jgi:hypothetical protein
MPKAEPAGRDQWQWHLRIDCCLVLSQLVESLRNKRISRQRAAEIIALLIIELEPK